MYGEFLNIRIAVGSICPGHQLAVTMSGSSSFPTRVATKAHEFVLFDANHGEDMTNVGYRCLTNTDTWHIR